MNASLALLTFLSYDELNSIRGLTEEAGVSCIGGKFIDVLFNTLRPRKDEIARFYKDETLKDDEAFHKFIFRSMFIQIAPRQLADTKFCTDTLYMSRDQYEEYCRTLIYNYVNNVKLEW